MAIARDAHRLGDPLKAFQSFEDRACVHLPDKRALNRLPRLLRCGIAIAAIGVELTPPLGEISVTDQHVYRTAREIDANPAAIPQEDISSHLNPSHGRSHRARLADCHDERGNS